MSISNQQDITASLTIEAQLASGAYADLHKAIDRVQREGLLIWVMRAALPANSPAAAAFISRLESIHDMRPTLARIKAFGIDGAGIGYAVFPNLDGCSVTEGNIAITEAERRFVACLRMVGRLHSANIVCGDISSSSFWVNRSGEIDFLGVTGAPYCQADQVQEPVAVEALPFICPNLKNGAALDTRTDVFAMGVLGYYLLMDSFPYGSGQELLTKEFKLTDVAPLSSEIQVPPIWASEVLMRCLEPDPLLRFADANEVMQEIIKIRERSINMQMAPAKIAGFNSPRIAQPNRSMTVSAPLVAPKSSGAQASSKTTARTYFLAAVVIVCVLGFGVGSWLADRAPQQLVNELTPLTGMQDNAMPNLGIDQLVELLADDSTSVSDKINYAQIVKDSDDPLAQHVLIQTASKTDDAKLQEAAERSIVERGRRQGLVLSSEQVRQWLRTIKTKSDAQNYENVLKVLDASLPLAERAKILRAVYVTEPELILRLTTALAFDLDEVQKFQPLLAQLLGDKLQLESASEYSGLALIMADSDLALIFEDRINQRRDSLTDRDITWLMDVLGKRMDVNMPAVANLALKRKLVSPVRASLLEIVRDRTDLKPSVSSAIVNAAVGQVTIANIQELGRWYDLAGEPILLSIMATTTDREVLAEAFDTLAGKSPSREPSASLIRWIRANAWEVRIDLAPSIGVLGLQDLVSAEDQQRTFAALAPFLNNDELLDLLIAAEAPELLKFLLRSQAHRLSSNQKLVLLKDKSKEVRLAAIDAIDTNDVGALKMIVDAYDSEKDPEVRERFKKFWVIKDRAKN